MIPITTAVDYDDEDDVVRFTYPYFSMSLVHDAAYHSIQSYNNQHRIFAPKGGVPIEKMEAMKRTMVQLELVPPTTLDI